MSRKLQKVLLVYPEIPTNTYWSFKYALKFIKKKSAMPPLGLITIAALLPKTTEIKLIDMNIELLKEEDIQWADAVFISAMGVQKQSFKIVVERCNQLDKPIVAGGPYITVSHAEISNVGHFILGEAEEILPTFLEDFEQGIAKPLYASSSRPDITHTVLPRFDLLSIKAYASMSIQYSRGCPFNCEFCDVWQIYGRAPRIKSAENMIAELNALDQLGWRGALFVVDDNFIGNKPHVKNHLLPAFTQWQKMRQYPYRFYTEASVNLAEDDELLSNMKKAGFNSVFLGIETPSEKSLQETGKLQNIKSSMIDAIKKIQSYSIEVMGGFIVGFDSDDETIFDRQINFIQKTAIPKAMVGLLHAVPGTTLYARLKKENRILTDIFSGSNTHALETNFIPKMDPKVLKNGYGRLLDFLYGQRLKNYFKRCNQLLDNLGDSSLFQRDIHLAEIVMFFKSLFLQTFSRYGFQYIRFIMRNFFKNHQFFGEAVRMGIEGNHFYVITRQMLKADKFSTMLEEKYQLIAKKLNMYSVAISSASTDKMNDLINLWQVKKETFDVMKNKICTMPIEFREGVLRQYSEMDKNLRKLFRTCQADLIRRGFKFKIAVKF